MCANVYAGVALLVADIKALVKVCEHMITMITERICLNVLACL
jgi:hypothetical protein